MNTGMMKGELLTPKNHKRIDSGEVPFMQRHVQVMALFGEKVIMQCGPKDGGLRPSLDHSG